VAASAWQELVLPEKTGYQLIAGFFVIKNL
jgi:hypothetical protein